MFAANSKASSVVSLPSTDPYAVLKHHLTSARHRDVPLPSIVDLFKHQICNSAFLKACATNSIGIYSKTEF